MSSETVLVEGMRRKVIRSGGGAVIYIPPEIREHLKIGDSVIVGARIEGNKLVFVVSKSLFNFNLNDIMNLATDYELTVKDNKTVGDVQIFRAEKNNLSLSYTKNTLEKLSPAYVTVSFKKSNLDYDGYRGVIDQAKQLQKKFDVISRPEGDLDTINLLKDPEYYKLNRKKAIELLRESGRKIGVSLTARLNNKKNTLDEVKTVLKKLQ